MSLKFEIDEDEIKNFSQNAKEELIMQLQEYCKNLISEAERLGANFKVDDREIEITARFIKDSAEIKKNPYYHRKKSKKNAKWNVISAISIFLAGILFDLTAFQSNLMQLIIFLICTTCGIFSTIMLYFKEGEDE